MRRRDTMSQRYSVNLPRLSMPGTAMWLMFGVLAWVGVAAPVLAAGDATGAIAPVVDDILTKLEQRSDGLKDIRCKIRLVEDDQINLAKNTKIGRLRLMVTDANPRAFVHFERCEIDGILRKQEWYLFDGRFWFEAIERLEQVTKREIAREGETFDLFNLETSPFPMPFGQKKATIFRNFTVEWVARAKGDPENTDHLRLLPKPGSRLDRKYTSLDYYVRRGLNLPVRIVIGRNEGMEIVTVDFMDLAEKRINVGLGAKDFAKPKAWQKYDVVEELLADAP